MNDLKRKILSAKPPMEKIHVAEWDSDVYIRRMNGLERDDYIAAQEQAVKAQAKDGVTPLLTLQSKILSITLCDESGVLLFPDPLEVSKEIDGLVRERLSSKALDVNGMTKESKDAIEKKASMTTTSGTT